MRDWRSPPPAQIGKANVWCSLQVRESKDSGGGGLRVVYCAWSMLEANHVWNSQLRNIVLVVPIKSLLFRSRGIRLRKFQSFAGSIFDTCQAFVN